MMLAMLGTHGMNGGRYQAVEFCGEAVVALGMAERMTLSNMSAELGAQVGLVAPDETTRAWLAEHGAADVDIETWHGDAGAAGEWHHFDATTLAPQVALPHSPANVRAVTDLERTRIDVAYVGACTGAKLEDLRAAASVLRGRQVAPGVQLLVAPASVTTPRWRSAKAHWARWPTPAPRCCPAPAAPAPATAAASPKAPRSSHPPHATSRAAWVRPLHRCTWDRPTRWRRRRCAA